MGMREQGDRAQEELMQPVHLYVLDTFADWEPGYLLAELHTGRYLANGDEWPVQVVAATDEPVRSMGGIEVTPDVRVDELEPDDSSLLILPGADTWADPRHERILAVAGQFLDAGVPVAAICGATIAMADAGMLDDRPHTSNDLDALKAMAPNYRGEQHYRTEPVVRDGQLITASGVAPAHFAAAVLRALDAMTDQVADAWLKLNTTQEPRAFYELMELTSPRAAEPSAYEAIGSSRLSSGGP
jgi:putative intracellular protease/amidase